MCIRRTADRRTAFGGNRSLALVDEATGYQDFRARDALAKILEKFVAKELRPWIRTLPAGFYREIYRLNGWSTPRKRGPKPETLVLPGPWEGNVSEALKKPPPEGVWPKETPKKKGRGK